jgi:hypothetical protein
MSGFDYGLFGKRGDILGKWDIVAISFNVKAKLVGACEGKGVIVFFIVSKHKMLLLYLKLTWKVA